MIQAKKEGLQSAIPSFLSLILFFFFTLFYGFLDMFSMMFFQLFFDGFLS